MAAPEEKPREAAPEDEAKAGVDETGAGRDEAEAKDKPEPGESKSDETGTKDAETEDSETEDGEAEDEGPELLAPPLVPPDAELPKPQGIRRVRLVQIYRIGSVVLGVLLIAACAVAGSALYQAGKARGTLVNRVDPVALEQYKLSSAIAAQDTAIRRYTEEGGPDRLAEYRTAIAQEATSAATMRTLLAGVPGGDRVVRLVDQVTASSREWRVRFADRIAAERGGGGLSGGRSRQAGGLFDRARNGMTPLQGGITALHKRAAHRLQVRANTALWSVGAALAVAALAVLLLALVIRRTVVRPVASLGEQVRAVAQGDFAHRLDVSGPAEINELAVIIDAMRRRIIEEWRTSTERAVLLDEQAGELRRSNAELEQFAYVASHDLQEPLRKVASFCQMLDRRYGDQLDERGRQYIVFAVDGAKRMQALISDLLGFSRVGRLARPEDAIDLNEVAGQALDNLGSLVEETGAQVEIGDLPTVPGERTQLTQLFQNLVGNAIKFRRPDVAPRVAIDVRREGDEWLFTCADNGIGIEPRYADRIFLIFQRLHPRDEYTGTGIGLALCKKIVEYHGGRIWLDEDERGENDPGTTFHWTLPIGDDND
ncbi:ATP-binding protein [Actinomadura opuntiae]|uniref:ATP-binding protein n=1 Tax=Actinomadura sp. OS1-43 TaxID=604315 RepID=UPI00255A88CF|nr:ATP-binding protein [Actinomadura sp. OS1-43]MDL4813485.1 ATP-binding protein [Actinomadura sp. OS1-43]